MSQYGGKRLDELTAMTHDTIASGDLFVLQDVSVAVTSTLAAKSMTSAEILTWIKENLTATYIVPVVATINGTINAGTNRIAMFGSDSALAYTDFFWRGKFKTGYTLQNLYVSCYANTCQTGVKVTILKNNANSALTCTVAHDILFNEDAVNTVAFLGETDIVAIAVEPPSGTGNYQNMIITAEMKYTLTIT
jgi:hypothetical protein